MGEFGVLCDQVNVWRLCVLLSTRTDTIKRLGQTPTNIQSPTRLNKVSSCLSCLKEKTNTCFKLQKKDLTMLRWYCMIFSLDSCMNIHMSVVLLLAVEVHNAT